MEILYALFGIVVTEYVFTVLQNGFIVYLHLFISAVVSQLSVLYRTIAAPRLTGYAVPEFYNPVHLFPVGQIITLTAFRNKFTSFDIPSISLYDIFPFVSEI